MRTMINRRAVIGVPGIHSTGEDSTRRFLWRLQDQGYHTEHPDLPVRWALTARFMKDYDAKLVANCIRAGDALVCHSYGCLRGTLGAIRAYQKNQEAVSVLFLIAPAMEPDFVFNKLPPTTQVICLYSEDDLAIKAGSKLWWHPFGEAGNTGFNDPRVLNISANGNDHDDYFNRPEINKWVNTFLSYYLG